jgi:hypothetical protein
LTEPTFPKTLIEKQTNIRLNISPSLDTEISLILSGPEGNVIRRTKELCELAKYAETMAARSGID